MKKMKLFYCILLSIFLCGCTANYNINITETGVEENFEFYESDKEKFDNSIYAHTDYTYRKSVLENSKWPTGAFYQRSGNPYEPVKIDGVEYYNQELIDDNNKLGIKYDYTFQLDNYNESNAVKSCFEKFSFNNTDEIIKIYVKNASPCFETRKLLEKINIKLTSSYKVIKHNADSVKNNKYIWNIDSNNASSKVIDITLTKQEDIVITNNSNNSYLTLIIILAIFVIFLGTVFTYLYYKNKESNKI